MRATVLVRPKHGILDPQGEAVRTALDHLGFEASEARVGRVIDLEFAGRRSSSPARTTTATRRGPSARSARRP